MDVNVGCKNHALNGESPRGPGGRLEGTDEDGGRLAAGAGTGVTSPAPPVCGPVAAGQRRTRRADSAQMARDEALPFLGHGTQVVVPHASHVDDLWGRQPKAMQHLVITFSGGPRPAGSRQPAG